jgi:hypothetical protein
MVKSWLKVGVLLPLGLLLGACNALLETPSPLEVSLSFPREVAPGSTASGTLTVRSAGYTGQASLRLVSPAGFTLVEPSTIEINPGTNEYVVRVQVGSNVQPRSYEVVVEVTPQGGVPTQVRGTLRVTASSSDPPSGGGTPGLTAQVNPDSLTVYQGGTGSLTLTLTPSGGLTGLALFSLESGGSPVPWASLSPSYVNITSASQQSVPLTLSVASGAPEGTYNLVLKIVHSAGETRVPLSLTVRAPTFNISLSRTALTLIPRRSASFRVTITNEGGFSGTVRFSLVGGSEARMLELIPTEVDITPDDTSVVVPLTITAGSISPGEYPVYFRATSGTIERRFVIDVTVPEPPYFNLNVTPARLEVPQGTDATLTLTVTPLHGFTGTLELELESIGRPNPGIRLTPPAVPVSGSAPQSYTLILGVPDTLEPGSYLLLLRARDSYDNISRSNLIEVRVTAR